MTDSEISRDAMNPAGDDQTRQQPRKSRQRGGKAGKPGATFEIGPEIEAIVCAQAFAELPQAFPPQPREGMVTKRWQQVATTEGAVLFCDMNHRGEHIWPVGFSESESGS